MRKVYQKQECGSQVVHACGLETLITEFLDKNPKIISDYQKNDKAANQVIGYVMRQTGGKYSSAEVVEATKKMIEARF